MPYITIRIPKKYKHIALAEHDKLCSRICILTLLFLVSSLFAKSQTVWTLAQCVDYAWDHNTSLQIAEVNQRLAALELKQSKLSRLPSLNTDFSVGASNGRSINPVTNSFVTSSYLYTSGSVSSGALLFGWFQKRYQIQSQEDNLQSMDLQKSKAQNDLSLNVATAYLQCVLAQNQIAIQQNQLEYSQNQLQRTEIMVKSGTQPELNLYQVKSQLASDSTSYISAVNNYKSAILSLKALMNMDYEEELDVVEPPIVQSDIPDLLLPSDSDILVRSMNHLPNVKLAEKNMELAWSNYKIARAQKYPQLSVGFNLGTNWSSLATSVNSVTVLGVTPTSQYFIYDNTGIQQPVYTYDFQYNLISTPFWTQIKNNNRSNIAISLSIPLFQSWNLSANEKRSKLNYEIQELNLKQSKVQLGQEVLQAKNDAINAYQVWKSSEVALSNAEKSFQFAEKRYDLGLMNVLEFQLERNNYFKAQVQTLSNKLDFIFKTKILDFYIGNPIR